MSVRQLPESFQVAFSFAGEQRELVRSIAEAVEQHLGPSRVFLDADLKLQKLYGH